MAQNNPSTIPAVVFSVERDGRFVPRRPQKHSIVEELPPGIFTLKLHPEEGYYLDREDIFTLPEKIYGKTSVKIDRFFRSYELNNKNLGVMFRGVKGGGKTLTIKRMSIKAVEMKMPVILINNPYCGDAFIEMINNIRQNCLIVFDEFEKIYGKSEGSGGGSRRNDEAQTAVLKLLDGTATGHKKLYLISVNKTKDLSEYFFNRPSRIRYDIVFESLPEDVVVDYVSTNLKNPSEETMAAFMLLSKRHDVTNAGYEPDDPAFSMDTMSEIIREMNQFGESVTDVLELMNPEILEGAVEVKVTVFGPDGFNEQMMHSVRLKYEGIEMPNCKMTVKIGDNIINGVKYSFNTLTEKNFIGFGDTVSKYVFKKGDYTFIAEMLAYSDFVKNNHDRLTVIDSEKDIEVVAMTDLPKGVAQFAQVKTANNSVSGSSSLTAQVGRGLSNPFVYPLDVYPQHASVSHQVQDQSGT